MLIFEKIHITECYLIKYLVEKQVTIFGWSKPLQKFWTGVSFGH